MLLFTSVVFMCECVSCADDLQNVFEDNADKGGEAAVPRYFEATELGLPPETRTEEEDF